MKKTLIAVVLTAFISSGAMAKPSHHHVPNNHNHHIVVHHASKPVHMASHHSQPAPRPYVARHKHRPHHHHNHIDVGSALIAFAILATAM